MSNRIIKDTIWTSPTINALSVYAERHFYRILLLVDDWGCFQSTPAVVRGICYPLQDNVSCADVQQWQRELEEKEILVTWSNGGRCYSMFKSFDKHNTRYSVTSDGKPARHRRKTPVPPDNILERMITPDNIVEENCYNPKPNPKPNPNPNQKQNPSFIPRDRVWG